MKKLILGAVAGSIVLSGVFALLPAQTRTQPTQAATSNTSEPFDHSNCQYPNRWSNPVDGCDNSDPAVPECVGKGTTEAEERACIDAFVKKHQEPVAPTEPVQTAPAPIINQCGGSK